MLKLRDGTRKSDKFYLLTRTCIKPTNKLVNSLSGAPLVLGQATGNSGLIRLTTPELGGSHHLPPYNILCASPRHPHPNGFLSWDSQRGVPKLSQFGLPRLCEIITLCSDLRSGWGLKQLVALLKNFPKLCHTSLTHTKVGSILNF
jgi:hypothetical protein